MNTNYFFASILITFLSCSIKQPTNSNNNFHSNIILDSTRFIFSEDLDGKIKMNSKFISKKFLDSIFIFLNDRGDTILYDCENQSLCPPPNSEVIKLVNQYGLQIQILISKPNWKYIPVKEKFH